MCVQLLTRYTLFQSFKRHNIAIITHEKHHGKYNLKQAKWAKIVLEMHDRAKNTCVFFQHVVVCSGMVWRDCQVSAKSFDACAAACAWSGRWHEMCVQLLT